MTPSNIVICSGNTTTLTASLTSSPTAGVNNANLTYQWYKENTLIAGAENATLNPTSSGNYSVIATNGLGCTSISSGSVSVTVNPLPTASITGGAELILSNGINCNNTAITLTANSNSVSATYQWLLDGVLISGATSSTYSTTNPGIYTVQVISPSGCSNLSSGTKVLSPPTASASTGSAVCQGGLVILTVNSAGISSPTYQWYQDIGSGFISLGTNANSATYSASVTGLSLIHI